MLPRRIPLVLDAALANWLRGLAGSFVLLLRLLLRLVQGADEEAGVRWLWQVRDVDEVERADSEGLRRYPRAPPRACMHFPCAQPLLG